MKYIGLLSDTHGYIDDKILDYLKDCDEIWHGGDIGKLEVTDRLSALKPLKAVWGNIDNHLIRATFKENLWFKCEDLTVWITHIAGKPPKYNANIREQLSVKRPDILVCGHSHILKIERVPEYDNMLHINPGAAGKRGYHKVRTLVRFKIDQKRIFDMEVVEMGR